MLKVKNIDDKFSEIGFTKVAETAHGAIYERNNKRHNYVQVLAICHKNSGRHIIQSYQKDLNKDKCNNVVGLSLYEMRLGLKKARQLGFGRGNKRYENPV